jgi:palmitoyltransferase ZDHHC9/14/18
MASNDPASRPTSPGDDDGFPNPQRGHSEMGGPPSIISSRMTDIASDDGGETDGQQSNANQRRSIMASDAASRPGTARTGVSSTRGAWPQSQPLRKNYLSGLAAKRGSVGAGSIVGSVGGRPSSTSRSHVPSLTSHAFFHPMSSQKLQAQRSGASRPPTVIQQQDSGEESAAEMSMNPQRQSVTSNPIARLARQLSDDGNPPPSRGSEMTEQETLDRITANTSPTQGHHPTASLSESVRPLQKKLPENNKNLSVTIDKSYKDRGNLPSPIKSPRSFRSSFLLAGKSGDQGQNGSSRNLRCAEKLSSTASSPRLQGVDSKPPQGKQAKKEKKRNLGRVHQYFDGNMVFCLGGRWQNAKQRPVNIATGGLVVVPCTLFFIFSASWLWHNISPAIPITFAYVFYISLSSFIHASVSDPGVSSCAFFRNLQCLELILGPRFCLGIFTDSLRPTRTRIRCGWARQLMTGC